MWRWTQGSQWCIYKQRSTTQKGHPHNFLWLLPVQFVMGTNRGWIPRWVEKDHEMWWKQDTFLLLNPLHLSQTPGGIAFSSPSIVLSKQVLDKELGILCGAQQATSSLSWGGACTGVMRQSLLQLLQHLEHQMPTAGPCASLQCPTPRGLTGTRLPLLSVDRYHLTRMLFIIIWYPERVKTYIHHWRSLLMAWEEGILVLCFEIHKYTDAYIKL